MPRTPARRTGSPARRTPRPRTETPPVEPGSPVSVRIIGHDHDVRRLVAAMQASAGGAMGPVDYRPARSGGTRAYLNISLPADQEQK